MDEWAVRRLCRCPGIGPECIDFDETCDYFFVEGVDVIKNEQVAKLWPSQGFKK